MKEMRGSCLVGRAVFAHDRLRDSDGGWERVVAVYLGPHGVAVATLDHDGRPWTHLVSRCVVAEVGQ